MDEIKQEGEENTSPDSSDSMKTENSEENTANHTEQRKKFFRRKNLNIIFSVLITIVTSLYTYFSCVQWQAMKDALERADTSNAKTQIIIEDSRKQSDSTNKYTRQSIAAAETSIIVAQETFEVNKLTMITSNTAYISAHPRILKFIGDTLIIKIIIKNNGKTPALDLSIDASTDISLQDYSRVLFNLDSGVFIAPNDSAIVGTREVRHYMEADRNNILTGGRKLNVEGVIGYTDVYGGIYRVDFHFLYDPHNQIWETMKGENTYKKIGQKNSKYC